ncbi:Ig-like domain-containing protein [Flexithrix dorotheae]|uniref:Ig-like domain-containing protein n=1 Tax=Flexithrix dorotheae TaxID=70993 RepID=UPI00146DF503|nr:Ig-like domain-containing protein [Flexithrix dorotheae]
MKRQNFTFLRAKWVLMLLLFIGYLDTSAQMYVDGWRLRTDEGEQVVLRGVNKMVFYQDRDGDSFYPEIAKTGANVTRIFWFTSGTAAELDLTIQNCINAGMLAMPAVWDATGDWSKLQQCIDYWARPDIAAVIQKYKRYVMLNIANEAGNIQVTDAQFRSVYAAGIQKIRNAGVTVPLVIDAAHWGRGEWYVLDNGEYLLDQDPLHNLMFSWHPWDINQTNARYDDAIADAKNKGLCFIVGEFAERTVGCGCCISYEHIMDQCQQEQIGWMAWSWGPGNGDCADMDMTSNGNFNTLHGWGLETAVNYTNSIMNTSVKPNILGGNNVAVSTTSLANALVGQSYSQNLEAIGGVTPYSWSITSGNLPSGLSLNGSTISGTPTSTGTYNFTIKVTDNDGAEDTNDLSIEVFGSVQQPYSGTPIAIPGIVEAEDFDVQLISGEAYFDSDAGNNGAAYRDEEIDIENTTDVGGGYNIGWIQAGEWMEYTINVANAGSYTIEARVASNNGDGSFNISFENGATTGNYAVGNTGGWQSWTSISKTAVTLEAGEQIMRIDIAEGGFNLNNITFTHEGSSNIPVTGISVGPGSVTLEEGETTHLNATVAPADASDPSVSWTSDDNSVATVNENGLVTAVSAGTANITVTSNDGNFTATSSITVNAPPVCDENVNIALGKTATASSEENSQYGGYLPASNTIDGNATTRWASDQSDPQWITIDLEESHTISRVELNWEAAYGADYQIQVSDDNTNWMTIHTVTNGNGGTDNLTGFSSTGRYVRLFGIARGTQWGYSLYEFEIYGCPENSSPVAVTGIAISPTSLSLEPGQTSQLTATVNPSNASNTAVSWSSSNTSVATVNAGGLVTAVADGTASITVTSADRGFTASSSISVSTTNIPVTGLEVSPTILNLEEGQTSQLVATISPTNATNQSVSWSSSNTSVASVNSSGLVTAVTEGSTTITATSSDGGFMANSAVTVTTVSIGSGYRYLRYTTTSANNFKLLELDWKNGSASVPSSNLSSNNSGGVIVSGNPGSTSFKAFDGQSNDNGGLWVGSGSGLNHQITLDLGAGNEISPTAITIHKFSWASVNGFRAEGSNDGSNWDLLLEETNANGAFSSAGGSLRAATYAIGSSSRIANNSIKEQTVPVSEIGIYPNPGTGNFVINFNSDYEGKIGLIVRNALGKEIQVKEITGISEYNLNLSAFPNGLYIVEFQLNHTRLTRQIVISR